MAALRRAVVEVQRDALRVLRRSGAFPAGQDVVRAEPLLRGIQQHALKVAAMDGDLRVREAREAAGGFAPDQLAEAVEEHAFLGLDADAEQRGFEAEAR